MRFIVALVDCSFIAAYFILADYVGPELVAAGKPWLWWLILFALVSGSYLLTRIPRNTRGQARINGRVIATAYLLLLITLYLYDFSVRPLLDRYHMGNAWIICLILTLVTVVIGTWKSRPGERPPSEHSP